MGCSHLAAALLLLLYTILPGLLLLFSSVVHFKTVQWQVMSVMSCSMGCSHLAAALLLLLYTLLPGLLLWALGYGHLPPPPELASVVLTKAATLGSLHLLREKRGNQLGAEKWVGVGGLQLKLLLPPPGFPPLSSFFGQEAVSVPGALQLGLGTVISVVKPMLLQGHHRPHHPLNPLCLNLLLPSLLQ